MKRIILIIFLNALSFGFCQDIKLELLSAKVTAEDKVVLNLKIINNSDVNYIINNNFSFQENAPDFSYGTFIKLNLFINDSINIDVISVKFERQLKRNYNVKKYDVFFIKNKSEELIQIKLDQYLTEEEKIGLGMALVGEDDLRISLDVYQSNFINIKNKKNSARIRKENYLLYNGEIHTDRIILERE